MGSAGFHTERFSGSHSSELLPDGGHDVHEAETVVSILAEVLAGRVDERAYLHSSDLSDDERLDAGAKKIGRNLKPAADRAGLHAEKWSHNGVSTTWLVEDRSGDQKAGTVDHGDEVETDGGRIDVGGHQVWPDQKSVLPCPECSERVECYYLGSRNSLTAGDEPRSFAVSGWVCSECESTLEVTDEEMMADDQLTERDIILTDGGEDENNEQVVMNPNDPEEVSGHLGHEGFAATRFGAGDLVDIHISCDDCGVRYIIEDVPKDKAENPGKYVDRQGDQ